MMSQPLGAMADILGLPVWLVSSYHTSQTFLHTKPKLYFFVGVSRPGDILTNLYKQLSEYDCS